MANFGWSYPPGCTQAMVDEAVGANDPNEALMEKLDQAFNDADDLANGYRTLGDIYQNQILEAAVKICGECYQDGYSQGQSDEGMAQHLVLDQPITGVEAHYLLSMLDAFLNTNSEGKVLINYKDYGPANWQALRDKLFNMHEHPEEEIDDAD